MTKGQKIARGLGRSYDKLRTIFLKDVCLKVLSGDQNNYVPEATYDSHWFLDMQERFERTGPDTGRRYILLKVADFEGCRLEKLRNMTAVQIGNAQVGWLRFKVPSKPTFVPGMVPDYHFKVSPTGERV
jgi:hypothetical protein